MDKIKKYRVWMIINPPDEPITIPVSTMNEAIVALKVLAKIGNHPDIDKAMVANVSGLEEYNEEEQEWQEWYDYNGEDVEYYWQQAESDDNLTFNSFYTLESEVIYAST